MKQARRVMTLRHLQKLLAARALEGAKLLTDAAAGKGFDVRRALKLAGQHVRLAEWFDLGPEDAEDE